VKEYVHESYLVLVQIFEYYAAMNNNDPFVITLNAATSFFAETDIVDDSSKFVKTADLDTLFIVTNLEKDKNSAKSKLNPDRALTRFEFMEILIRIAIAKYTKDGPMLSPSEAVNKLLVENVSLAPPIAQLDSDLFRKERLYKEATDDVLRDNLPLIKALYNYYKGLGRNKTFPMKAWLALQDAVDIITEQFVLGDAVLCYVKSRMQVVDTLATKERAENLQIVDFMEALCRVCDMYSIPTPAELTKFGAEDLLDYEDKVAGGITALPEHASASMLAPKSRSLGEKLPGFLNLVRGRVAKNLGLGTDCPEEKLIRHLQKNTKFLEGNVK